ncbi:MAG: DUF3662 domain-containing protein [Candidatus Eremiobacteraeota bacterium]|nr:DUF3662 domain-containing protein [Candidatus Eremiobacteraeota bacterium]
MSLFSRIEEACASLIERAFARTFPSDLEPAHIARKLVATMEAKASHEGRTIVAPGTYTVRVSAEDFARLAAHRQYLEQEWAALIAEVARRVSIAFDEPPDVMLVEDPAVVTGAVEIDTAFTETPAAKHYRLRIVKGLPPEGIYPLDRTVAIGRSTTNDVVLTDPRVSRRHARIETSSGEPILVDLDSTNGTFVNGKRVTEPLHLSAGNVMTLGNTTLAIEEE